MRETLPLDTVIALAEAGETFTLEAGDVPVSDLVLLATIIGDSGARVRFRNVHGRSLEDLMRITVASRGRVYLETLPAAAPTPLPRSTWFRRRGVARSAGPDTGAIGQAAGGG